MNLQQQSDKIAIGLSVLCVLHCLIIPFVLLALPGYAVLEAMQDELFHHLLLWVIIPFSAITLWVGLRRHRNDNVLYIGLVGSAILTLPVVLGHDLIGEIAEVGLTVMGSLIIAFSHWRNYRLGCASRCENEF